MVISSRRAGASRLREAVDAYRAEQKDKLDKPALALLDRLADSPDAAKLCEICEGLKSDEASFLTLCIKVEQVARTFPAHIKAEQKMLARLKRLDKAIADLREFVAEETKGPPPASDLLTRWTGFRGGDAIVAAILRGLDLIVKLIEGRRYIVNTTAPWLGATRDKHHKEAANNAAIWHVADAVRRATGKAHREKVAELAQVILEADVSIERVDNVVRTRKYGGAP